MWFDVLILAIVAFTTLRGAMKGVLWQLAAIAALVLCFVFAQSGSLAIAPHIPLEAPANRWVAMFLIYVVFSFLSFGAARMLREGLEKAKFTEFDRHLGAAFGLIKGVIFGLVVIFFSVTMSESLRATVMNTYSGHYAAILMDRLHPVMPDELHDVLEPYIHRLDAPGMDLKYGDHEHGHDHGTHGGDDPFAGFDDPFGGRGTTGPLGSRPADASRPVPQPRDLFDDPLAGRGAAPAGREPRFDDDPFSSTRREPSPFDPVPPSSARPLDPRPRSDEDVLADLARRLTGAVSDEVKNQVLDAVRKSDPADRDELISRLTRALPGVIRAMADDSDPDPAPASRDARAERGTLLREISESYSDSQDRQAEARAEFEDALSGIPERVALAVLRDWRSDLYELDRAADPDPSTDVSTSLDARIVKQLAAARVPLSSLSQSLQERLRGADRR